MRLALFNGSPRAARSNTRILIDWFLEGFLRGEGNQAEVHHVNRVRLREEQVQRFAAAEQVIVAFPLYHDSVPGILKHFIEALEPLCQRAPNPPLGFVVQSGFPEARHSRAVERYLAKLARRLHAPYLGTVVKGGVEGIQIKPPWMNRSLRRDLVRLGQRFAETGAFDPQIVARLARPERLPLSSRLFLQAFGRTDAANFYWSTQLKKNGAFERRFARPFEA
jgi:NAD(P)H-dependent FMN reductase